MFGIKLKKVMDELGVEAVLTYPGDNNPYQSLENFFIQKLTKQK